MVADAVFLMNFKEAAAMTIASPARERAPISPLARSRSSSIWKFIVTSPSAVALREGEGEGDGWASKMTEERGNGEKEAKRRAEGRDGTPSRRLKPRLSILKSVPT